MNTIKCKKCSAIILTSYNENVCKCHYCNTEQTLPGFEDSEDLRKYEEAKSLCSNMKFELAKDIYERLLSKYPKNAELYWSVLLCNYSISYKDLFGDNINLQYCGKSCEESIYENNYYKYVLEYSNDAQKNIYENHAEKIYRINKVRKISIDDCALEC